MKGSDEERAELDRLTEMLGRNTRSGKLLAHIGEKYFEGREEHLTEFHIATEVFVRSPKTFIAADDAVVRVEAHRLRKKLRDAYASGEGAGSLRIVVPTGSYVPKFERVSLPPVKVPRRKRVLPWLLVACGMGAVAIGVAYNLPEPAPVPSLPSGITELHVMAGHDGGEIIDDAG